jgi:ribosomal protein S18 acetylase RimI-like enzyme
MNYQIKMSSLDALVKISRCHRAVFPSSLSSALGIEYVKAMLSWYLTDENAFLFYVEENGHCLGYCGGMLKKIQGVGSASSMAQHSFNAAVLAFIQRPWLLFHPDVRAKRKFIVKNLINRLVKGSDKQKKSKIPFEPYAGLVVIGVDPGHQRQGYGSLLLKEFEKITRQKSLKRMTLSVRSDNHQAIKSYIRNGWSIKKVDGKHTSMEKLLV